MRSGIVVAGCLLVACTRYELRNELDVPGLCPSTPDSTRISVVRHGVLDSAGDFGSVRGRIGTRDARVGVAEARVCVIGPNGRRVLATDSLGTFRVESLPPGRYAIEVLRVGYHATADTVDLAPGTRVQLD